MNIDNKLTEYKNNIDTLRAVESLEVYRWLISLGEKLNHDPLSCLLYTSDAADD